MKKEGEIKEFVDNLISKANRADGKIIGEDGDFIKSELARDDKGAWVNHLSEQYLKKEVLDTPPEELNIDINDIIKEISIREIKKMLGK